MLCLTSICCFVTDLNKKINMNCYISLVTDGKFIRIRFSCILSSFYLKSDFYYSRTETFRSFIAFCVSSCMSVCCRFVLFSVCLLERLAFCRCFMESLSWLFMVFQFPLRLEGSTILPFGFQTPFITVENAENIINNMQYSSSILPVFIVMRSHSLTNSRTGKIIHTTLIHSYTLA